MNIGLTEISWKGKWIKVPAVTIDGVTLIIQGRGLKTARIKDEIWLKGEVIGTPETIVSELRRGGAADIFTFCQKKPGAQPGYDYPVEWHNVAAVPVESFAKWWDALPRQSKQNIKRAEREGVVVTRRELDDELIAGIVRINNESPVRQGRPFWHYGKSFEAVKRDYSDFLDRSTFLTAHYQDELIGLMRLIDLGHCASVLQLLCLNAQCQRRPANALIAKGMEFCVERKFEFFVYGQFVYGSNVDSSLTEFKKRNGFVQYMVPSYQVPLSVKGKVALALHLHKGIKEILPRPVMNAARGLRRRIAARKRGEPAEKTTCTND
jgi:hypothetical protein